MAVKDIILGKSLSVIVNSVVVACATDVKVTITTTEIDVTCAGSGNMKQKTPGRTEVTWDTSGLWRQTSGSDVATNITAKQFIDWILAGTQLTLVLSETTPASGDIVYTGIGYAKDVSISGVVDSVEKFTASGWFNSFVPTVTAP